jgi:hypothetical protein
MRSVGILFFKAQYLYNWSALPIFFGIFLNASFLFYTLIFVLFISYLPILESEQFACVM